MTDGLAGPPTLIYDDDCGFCTWCAEYAAARGSFDLVGFTELDAELERRLPEDYESCTHLLADERRYSCGAAVEAVVSRLDTPVRFLARGFQQLPARERIREPAYRLVADNRQLAGRVVRREPPAESSS